MTLSYLRENAMDIARIRGEIAELEKHCKCSETNGGGDCDACQEIEHLTIELKAIGGDV